MLTGVAVETGGWAPIVSVSESVVEMAGMDDAAVDAYVASGRPLDKAGAYAIQGGAAAFVECVEGSWANVVGLPVERLGAWLARLVFQGAEARLA